WVSRREDRVVTRRSAGPDRRGSRSWTPPKNRPAAPPAAVRAWRADCWTAAAPAVTLSARGIGDLSGVPARGSGGLTGTSLRCFVVADTSVASNAIAPSLPV